MAVLFPQLQFFDNNGAPLALGKVYTYITGTTTPKSTWTTAAESANHPNPVILDDEGRAEIWLSTDSEYRITIKSATDATIQGPIDNVTGVGIQLSSFSELASDLDVNGYSLISSNNGDINFTPNGSGDVKVNTTTGTVDITNTTGGINVTSTTGDINLKTTSGAINVGHLATGPGSLRFLEDTDNGANYIEVIAPASVASNKVQTLQDVTGTVYVSSGTDVPVTDGGTGASDAATARTNLGVGSGDSPTFANPTVTTLEVGAAATDTTLSRLSAGNLAVEGNLLYRAGGTDVPITDGGTGQSTAAAAFNALSPITTTGDLIYSSSGTTNSRLGIGAVGSQLTSTGTAPAWSTQSFEATASGAATLALTGISTSGVTKVEVWGGFKPDTDGQEVNLVFGYDAGPSYLTSSYGGQYIRTDASTVSTGTLPASSAIALTMGVGADNSVRTCFRIIVEKTDEVADAARWFLETRVVAGDWTYRSIWAQGQMDAAVNPGALTAVKLTSASGNITGVLRARVTY